MRQEEASIARCICEILPSAAVYYDTLPDEGFVVPAVYFPAPEVMARSSTLSAWAARYSWYIKIFAATARQAHELADKVVDELMTARRLVPLVGADGGFTGRTVRIDDPSVRTLNDTPGAAQLTITWDCCRDYFEPESTKVENIIINVHPKQEGRNAEEKDA